MSPGGFNAAHGRAPFQSDALRNPIFAIVVLVIACIALKLFETWVNPWKCRDCSMTF